MNFLNIILYLYCKSKQNNMIHPISTNLFRRQNQVNVNGETHHSVYNHNYYTSEDGLIILEECNDEDTFYYYNVDPNTGDTEYYGLAYSTVGIFDENYDGFSPERDDNGIVELDTDFC